MSKELLWGYINRRGEIVIDPSYHGAGDFSEGLAMVKIDYQRGYIDKDGLVVIEPQFEAAGEFLDGKAPVKKDDEWGVINKDGTFEPFPQAAEVANADKGSFQPFTLHYSEGLAAKQEGEKIGYVDEKGEFVIPPKYTDAEPFHEGLARVRTGKTGKWGFIDFHGKMAFKEKFIQAGDFHDGLAKVLVEVK